MNLRRQGDKTKLIRSLFGSALVLFAIAAKFFANASDWLVIGLVLVGAGLVSPSFIVDLVKAWRSSASA